MEVKAPPPSVTLIVSNYQGLFSVLHPCITLQNTTNTSELTPTKSVLPAKLFTYTCNQLIFVMQTHCAVGSAS